MIYLIVSFVAAIAALAIDRAKLIATHKRQLSETYLRAWTTGRRAERHETHTRR